MGPVLYKLESGRVGHRALIASKRGISSSEAESRWSICWNKISNISQIGGFAIGSGYLMKYDLGKNNAFDKESLEIVSPAS